MSTKKATTNTILLLYDSTDSTEWKDYFKENLEHRSLKLKVIDKDVRMEIADIIPICSSHTQVTIIVSNPMLEILMMEHSQLAVCLKNHPCVSVIGLYQDTKYIASKLAPFYSCDKVWNYFDILENNEDKVTFIILQIIELLEDTQRQISKPVVLPKAPKQRPVEKKKSIVKLICPSSVRQGGEKVIIVLQKSQPAEEIVQVQLNGNETIIDTEKLNDMCYSFIAPAYKAGIHTLYILLGGKKLAKLPIHYADMCSFAYTFPQYLCQLIGLGEGDIAGLDQHLTNIFKSSALQDGSLKFLLTPKNISAFSTAELQSDSELPTLLHFACKHGLNNLAASIVDTNSSIEALRMNNRNGKTPLDLATEADNKELVNYIKEVAEMYDYMQSFEEIYEYMSGKHLTYMNNPSPDSTTQHYLKMDGKFVEEAYQTREELKNDYIYEFDFTRKNLEGVSEVQEEEDVKQAPVRPPSLKRSQREPDDIAPPIPAYSPLVKESCNRDIQRCSGTLPCLPDHGTLPRNDLMAGPDPLSYVSMSSNTVEDLMQYQEAFKRGEFNLDDIERLFLSWQNRNHDASSTSLKEKKKQVEDFKLEYQPIIQSAQKGFFSRFKKNKIKPQIHVIEHNVPTTIHNNFETWAKMQKGETNRDSTISTTSTTSLSSVGSIDSALGTVHEVLSDESDDEPPPVVPRKNAVNQKSQNEQFIQSVKKCSISRLPKPPVQSSNTKSSTQMQPKPPPRL